MYKTKIFKISKLLHNNIKYLLDTKYLNESFKNNGYIAGGAALNLFYLLNNNVDENKIHTTFTGTLTKYSLLDQRETKRSLSDIDIFFSNKEDAYKIADIVEKENLNKKIFTKFPSNNVQYVEVHSLNSLLNHKYLNYYLYQFITSNHGNNNITEVLDNFDITNTKIAYKFIDNEVHFIYDERIEELTDKKQIQLDNCNDKTKLRILKKINQMLYFFYDSKVSITEDSINLILQRIDEKDHISYKEMSILKGLFFNKEDCKKLLDIIVKNKDKFDNDSCFNSLKNNLNYKIK